MKRQIRRIACLLLCVIILPAVAMLGLPGRASAEGSDRPLSSLSPGQTFCDEDSNSWEVIDPTDGYVILLTPASDAWNTGNFSDGSTNYGGSSIESFCDHLYNDTLTPWEQEIIQMHNWDTTPYSPTLGPGEPSTVKDRMGMLSFNDWLNLSKYYDGGFLEPPVTYNGTPSFWTLTPVTGSSDEVWTVNSSGQLVPDNVEDANTNCIVPACYMLPNVLISASGCICDDQLDTASYLSVTPSTSTPVLGQPLGRDSDGQRCQRLHVPGLYGHGDAHQQRWSGE